MRIGVLSDTHLKYVTTEFRTLIKDRFLGCEIVVHAGDFTAPSVYLYLDKVIEGKFYAVFGNMDPPELRKQLPEQLVFEVFGIKMGLIHGWGSPHGLEERIRTAFDSDVRCIIYGHSHNGVNHTVDNILFFNPGSPTDNYFAQSLSIGYITIQKGEMIGEIIPI
jgi:hypothetical protein